MEKTIATILSQHSNLLGKNAQAQRINVGFTNTIYNVDDKFIVKICSKESKETGFAKEIDFYIANAGNIKIPKLFYADTSKKQVPYYYSILEKVEGVTLYNVWHAFSEDQREDIIRQLCDIVKEIHTVSGEKYDWVKYNQEAFIPLFEKAKENNLFSAIEISLMEKTCSLFEKYLPSDEFVLVHNDLHFDNIIYNDGKIKLIDFERSMVAPPDFELDILYRMVRKPWKFASEEAETYTSLDQYENITGCVQKYYPQLTDTPHLYQRLAIYDMIYFLKQYVNAPQYDDLRCDVLAAAENILKQTTNKKAIGITPMAVFFICFPDVCA